MANTLNGINLAAIAQQSLDYLKSAFAPVNIFARDFSNEVSQKGASVATRIPSSATGQDLSGGYTAVGQDVTSTAVTVSLSNFKGFVYGFTDLEVSKAGNAEWLKQIFIVPAIEATVQIIISDAFALVTAANYATSTLKTAANFDADALVDAGQSLSTNKVPRSPRGAILKPTYTATLFKDSVIQSGNQYGSYAPVQMGELKWVHGVQINEFTGTIPNNGESLEGFIAHPSAMAMAARQIATPDNFYGQLENVTDDESGLPLQFRAWYDPNVGKTWVSIGCLYGFSKGQGNSLIRIKSA